MRFFLLSCLLLTISSGAALAQAKNTAMPDVPEALAALAERGAQLRYLGTESGMEGWIAIYQGQEQYYYVTPDKKAFVTGLMFGSDGRPVTIEQVQALQAQGGDVLNLLADGAPPAASEDKPGPAADSVAAKTPAERMFSDIKGSNWVRIGDKDAPVLYSFVDPNCPHCHQFIQDLRDGKYIDSKKVQVRIVPVGFQNGSLAQAAVLLASADGAERFLKYLDGDKDALPAKADLSTQAVQKNMALMQAWRFNVTPLTVYRSKSGEVKIVRGRAKDTAALVADLSPAAE